MEKSDTPIRKKVKLKKPYQIKGKMRKEGSERKKLKSNPELAPALR